MGWLKSLLCNNPAGWAVALALFCLCGTPTPWGWECVRPSPWIEWCSVALAVSLTACATRPKALPAWGAFVLVMLFSWQSLPYVGGDQLPYGEALWRFREVLSWFGIESDVLLFLAFLIPFVGACALARRAVRPDETWLNSVAQAGVAIAWAALIQVLLFAFCQKRYGNRSFASNLFMVWAFIAPAVALPQVLLRNIGAGAMRVWAFTMIPIVALIAICAGNRFWSVDTALLAMLGGCGPAWAIWDSARDEERPVARGFDVIC